MAMVEWIPNYIRKNIQYRPHEVLTAKEFNALLNLLITQGDYNSSWLEYLHTEGIPNAVADLNSDQIEKVLTEVVEAEVNALASSVVNKSSARLEKPVFAFLNLSMQADMSQFRTVVEHYEVPGSFCIATNLVGVSAAYPTLITLQAMRAAGHDILPLGADGSPYETATVDAINTALVRTKEYMRNNLKDTDVFVYPGGTTTELVSDTVGTHYTYAINTALAQSNLESDDLRVSNTRVQIPVVPITTTNTIDIDTVKAIIDDTIAFNRCCIIAVDTSSTDYSEEALAQTIEYVTAHAGITCTTVSGAMEMCANTINNQLRKLFDDLASEVINRMNADAYLAQRLEQDVLKGCYITEEDVTDEQGVVHKEKYLNW
jgi:hypothetical protein